jgi:hypothetical protein
MKTTLAAVSLVAVALLGLATAGTLSGGTTATATPIAGAWTGGGHKLQVAGSLEGGFSIAAGESWSIIGCPIASGTVLSRYAPKGGTQYDARYLWTENENGKCSSSERGPETVTVVLGGPNSLSITGCGYAFCGSLSRSAPITTTTAPPTTTKPAPTTTGPKPKDTKAPVVRALTKGLTKPGTRSRLQFTVSDDSGRARVTVTLYQGGTAKRSTTSGWGPANGSTWWWDAPFGNELVGPMYFCVVGRDEAGNVSKKSCAWISFLVAVEKVSNTCGGAGWNSIVAVQNYFGNKHSYQQRLGKWYYVDFAAACNLHDAGYGGHTVADAINGGIVDYHAWSRPRVDRKFLGDMRKLCNEKIPDSAANALEKCYSTGGALSIGSLALYNFVNKHGWRFFDADLTVPDIQTKGHRDNFE